MRTSRRQHSVMLVVVAALLLATAWIVVGDRADVSLRDPLGVTHTDRDSNGTLSPVDLADAAVTPVLGAARTAELRLAPLWVLPGLAAALAALCLLRRLRRSPTLPARRALLRGSRSNRAPPIGSFA